MEACMQPLQLFGDAARAAQGALQAPHLVPAIASRAQDCLDLLVAHAAQQVSTSHPGTEGSAAELHADPLMES